MEYEVYVIVFALPRFSSALRDDLSNCCGSLWHHDETSASSSSAETELPHSAQGFLAATWEWRQRQPRLPRTSLLFYFPVLTNLRYFLFQPRHLASPDTLQQCNRGSVLELLRQLQFTNPYDLQQNLQKSIQDHR